MTQYNSVNVKLSNSQLDKLKLPKNNETIVTLRFSSNLIGESYDETNFPRNFLVTDREVSKLGKCFANNLSNDIKSSKTQICRIVQSWGFIGRLL